MQIKLLLLLSGSLTREYCCQSNMAAVKALVSIALFMNETRKKNYIIISFDDFFRDGRRKGWKDRIKLRRTRSSLDLPLSTS